MSFVAEQFDFDWEKAERERPLIEQWERNRAADAHNWTDEAMAMAWAGLPHKDQWEAIPNYTRRHWIEVYVQLQAGLERGERMPPFEKVFPPFCEETYQQEKAMATRWAAEIQRAWMDRKPCPISCDRLVGPDRMRCERLRDWAFHIAAMKPENFAQDEAIEVGKTKGKE